MDWRQILNPDPEVLRAKRVESQHAAPHKTLKTLKTQEENSETNAPSDDEMAEIERQFSHDPEWPQVKDDPRWLAHLAGVVRDRRQRKAGKLPESYTAVGKCQGCGLIFIEPYRAGRELVWCPWCENRVEGLPIPRPRVE